VSRTKSGLATTFLRRGVPPEPGAEERPIEDASRRESPVGVKSPEIIGRNSYRRCPWSPTDPQSQEGRRGHKGAKFSCVTGLASALKTGRKKGRAAQPFPQKKDRNAALAARHRSPFIFAPEWSVVPPVRRPAIFDLPSSIFHPHAVPQWLRGSHSLPPFASWFLCCCPKSAFIRFNPWLRIPHVPWFPPVPRVSEKQKIAQNPHFVFLRNTRPFGFCVMLAT
jgi:hypothetical protein